MIRVKFQDTSFRDGFQSVFGARVLTPDFMPAVEAAKDAGIRHFEAGGGARFQSLFFYCGESAFDMMDTFRAKVGPDIALQTLARGINTVSLSSSPKDMIELHAQMFKKHGITHIRNFDALNDVRNLEYSGKCIADAGLHHQICVTLMDLPPGCEGAHTAEFYADRLRQIMDSGVPFHSVCFKDASGTANPRKVYQTLKLARQLVGDEMLLWFHTHDTAGVGSAQNLAAIEGGATKDDNMGICLAMSPVSGGTSQVDILSMWHALKGSGFDLDIDYEKILTAENVFEECMKDYFVPAEAKQVSPIVTLSPMPGGALTANTMMMRDIGTLHLYKDVIKQMSEVVRRGGFATSVTPVSQFYFQQAYANVTQGKWKKITQGYGEMVLGYFGRTPVPADPEIVALAAEQLGKKPFDGDPLDLLEPARPKIEKLLAEKQIAITDENVFIAHACGDKGVDFLQGKFQVNVRKNESPIVANAPAAAPVVTPAPAPSPTPVQAAASAPAVSSVPFGPGGVRNYRIGVGAEVMDVQVQDV
jgi:pyruvate carboxylase subunit B